MNVVQRRESAARSRIIGPVFAQWAAEQVGQFTPGRMHAVDPAYSEHLPLISASREAQDELHRRTTEALTEVDPSPVRILYVRHPRVAQERREDGPGE
jgi:hypothetical protein